MCIGIGADSHDGAKTLERKLVVKLGMYHTSNIYACDHVRKD
jgi:hypothetical protein